MTYDVTCVSGDNYVPLTAGTTFCTAKDIARHRSADGRWDAIQVRESGTGAIVATYVNGGMV